MYNDADVIIVGAGLAGLVAAAELVDAGRRVIILEQEPEASLGGQAFWSFGGLFLVNSPEQRRLGIRDSHDLALQDWLGSAAFDREEDLWPRRWAEAYVDFASGEKYTWLHGHGIRFFPVVQWAERGGYLATGHGNSVPRFHVTWGTGPGVIEREFALSGSEQNPDLTGRSILKTLSRILPGAPGPIEAFKRKGVDFVVQRRLPDLVRGMNDLTGESLIDLAELEQEIVARDREIGNSFSKDAQVTAIRGTRAYLGDRLVRVARPHRLLDPAAGPLIAVRLSILTRKTLGGVKTDLAGRVLQANDQPIPGLYAAGEVAGFGGGGVHGYRALEGTFLGGCLFSGRIAGRAVAQAVI